MSEDWVDVVPPASEGDSSGDWKDVPASTMTDRNSNEAPPQDIAGPDQPKGIDIDKGPAAMLRSPFLTKMSPMEAFNNPDKVPKFEAVYSNAIQRAIQKVPGVSNLPTDAQIALMHTVSYPAAVAGALVDTTLNPMESIAALITPGAAKGVAAAEDFMAPIADRILTKMKKPMPGVNFGGNAELTKIAEGASTALQAAKNAFSEGYNTLFEKVGEKVIPETLKNDLLLKATNAIEQTNPGSFASNYLNKKFPDILADENLDVKKLHAMKGDIFKHAKASLGVDKNALMQVYNGINQVLSHDTVAGQDYARLTSEYENFYKNESNYVKDLILDKFKNVSGQKLNKPGFMGIKSPINLADNYRKAFESLSGRPTTEMNVLKELDAVRKGEMLKRAAIVGASALLSPELRKVASFVSKNSG